MGSGHGRDAHGPGGDSVATGQVRIVKRLCDRIVTGCEGVTVRRYRQTIACTARQWMYHKR